MNFQHVDLKGVIVLLMVISGLAGWAIIEVLFLLLSFVEITIN